MKWLRATWFTLRFYRALRRMGYAPLEAVEYTEALMEWHAIHATRDADEARQRTLAQLWLVINKGEHP